MPVEFLTDEQAESYGTFSQEPTRPELERFFFLDDEDRRLIGKRRGDHSRLGFALQVCTVRYVGLFLQDPLAVPWPVVEYLAGQLGIADPSCVKKYTERPMTAYEHAWEIQEAFGYHAYEVREWGRKFRTFLYGRAWTHAEGPVALFNHAVAWLERHLTGVDLVGDLDLVTKELVELREVENALDVDDERGDPYAGAATLLYWQLRRAALMNGTIGSLDGDYLPVADDDFIVYSAPWSGPVVEAWQRNLTPLDEDETRAALRTRRVPRLLAHDSLEPDDVKAIHRDEHGRHVLVVALHSGVWSLAEWPKSLAVVDTWTDKTVLAADGGSGAVTLLALTPTEDGRMRTDPVPMQLRSWRDAFAYGYGGSTPGTTHTALLRCALGDTPAFTQARRSVCHPESQLWQAISTTKGPLRLSWPQVRLWAQADRHAAEQAAQQ